MFRRKKSAAATLTYDAIAQVRGWMMEEAADAGFNLVGVIAPASYDAVAPDALKSAQLLKSCAAVVAVGDAGDAIKEPMAAYSQKRSGYIDAEEDPVGWYTKARLGEILRGMRQRGAEVKALYAEDGAAGELPLHSVGELAGFGSASEEGELKHPEHGAEVALRGLYFVNLAFKVTASDGDEG